MKRFTVLSQRRTLLRTALAAPILLSWQRFGHAAKADAPPAADFFKPPQLSQVRMAPGGKAIAGLREIGGRFNVVVLDLSTRKTLVITNFKERDVGSLDWISPERLVFALWDRSRGSGNQESEGRFAINRDGSDFLQLTGEDDPRLLPRSTTFLGPVFEGGAYTGEVFVQVNSMQARGKFSSDVKRLNTVTRRATLLTLGGPRDVRSWVVDRQNVVRAAVSVSPSDGTTRLHLRDSAESPWRVIFEFGVTEPTKAVLPLEFDAEGNLYVTAYAPGTDNSAIYRLPHKSEKLDPEPLIAIKGFDVGGGLVFNQAGTKLLGIRYEADRVGTLWTEPRLQEIQTEIDRAMPGMVNDLDVDGLESTGLVLVNSYSDKEPGRYYLFDLKKRVLEPIASPRPWVKREVMRPTTFYRYKARDGLSIPAQLTLPEGSGKFPLVVLHYGGPWVRPIHWHWDPVVQFLASRGYAVLMPAPRASTGFGTKLFTAGWKQWGLAMQDDVTDGVMDLVNRGIVDAGRVCLAGASYGGYLTMMGLVKEPGLFKCGINWVGVTDPSFMFTVTWTDFNQVDSGRFDLPLLIGDPEKDKDQFKRTSPVERAAEIKQPVLMAYGGLDRRVPLVNGEKMLAALKPHNSNVEWVVYPDEGHGWLRLDNQVDFWNRVERFLERNL